ncbi:MAG: lipocalin-like domain-containing protein, partial [Bacteroidales bacterium]
MDKKKRCLRTVLVVTACMFACTIHAQGFLQGLNKDKLKESLQNVVENVASEHIRFNITGEWIYKGTTVNLKSSNQLANIGSQVLGNTLDTKINEQLSKIGVKPDMMRMTFNSDSTFQATTDQREIKGT